MVGEILTCLLPWNGAVDDEPMHNSRMLELLAKILHDPRSSMSLVEIAGRGIAAEACCHLSVPPDDKTPNDEAPELVVGRAFAFADRVAVLRAIEDDLSGVLNPIAEVADEILPVVWPRPEAAYQIGHPDCRWSLVTRRLGDQSGGCSIVPVRALVSRV